MRALTFQHLPCSLQVESHIHHIDEAMHLHLVHAAEQLVDPEKITISISFFAIMAPIS